MNMQATATLSDEVLAEGRRRYAEVRSRIDAAAERAGRNPSEITLVGVAKKQPLERTLAAIHAGLRVLGQSYIQEARDMRPAVESVLASHPETADIRLEWRMVGQLQRNKAALAARLFDAVESVDRPALVETLARRAEMEGCRIDVLLQLSLCGEPQKGGCEAEQAAELARQVRSCPSLRLSGLMTVPAADPDPEAARPVFRALRELRASLAQEDPVFAKAALSMGMSADLDVAVEEGATLVRIGTALFGERIMPPRSNN